MPFNSDGISEIRPGVAAAVLEHTGGTTKVLLVRRSDNGLWGLPSGKVEIGETVEEAVIREVKEETGLKVKVIRLVGVYSNPETQFFSYPSGRKVHFITTFFECDIIGGVLKADQQETLEVKFFEVKKLPREILPMHPSWLEDLLSGRKEAFIR